MDIYCPHCGTRYEVTEQECGRKALCEACNKNFIIGEDRPDVGDRQKAADAQQTIQCPHCGTEYDVTADEIGAAAQCEACGRDFVIGATAKPRVRVRTKSFRRQPVSSVKNKGKTVCGSTRAIPNYADNKNYFQPKTQTPVGCLVAIFIFAAVCLFSGTGGGALIGLVVMVVGIVFAVQASSNKHKPTDRAIDMQAQAMGRGLDEIAFGKLGIDPDEVSSAEPLRFWGYRFEYPSVLGDDDDNNACWVLGEDGNYRSSEVAHTIFFFGENSVYCFERTASLVGTSLRDSTEEYFYKDIVSVKTDTTNVPNRGKGVTVRTDEFILTNTGGERRVCAVENSATASAAVSAFRALLKQKKI